MPIHFLLSSSTGCVPEVRVLANLHKVVWSKQSSPALLSRRIYAVIPLFAPGMLLFQHKILMTSIDAQSHFFSFLLYGCMYLMLCPPPACDSCLISSSVVGLSIFPLLAKFCCIRKTLLAYLCCNPLVANH